MASKAIYPFIIGTASAHRWNLKDPRPLDDAFYLTYIGSPTHSTNGFLPAFGGNWARTHFNPSLHFAGSEAALTYYSRTNDVHGGHDMGTYDSGTSTNITRLTLRYTGNLAYNEINEESGGVTTSITDSSGFFLSNRLGNTITLDSQGKQVSTRTAYINVGKPNWKMGLGALDSAAGATSSNRECAGAQIYDGGLTQAQRVTEFKIWQQFNIRLKRAIGNHGTIQSLSDSYYVNDLPTVLKNNRFSVFGIGSGNSWIALTNSISWTVGQSISLWVKINSYGSTASLFSNKNTSHNSLVQLYDNAHIAINTDNAEGATFLLDTSGGGWNNIIISRISGSECRVYLNNVESASGPLSIGANVFTIDALMTYFTSIGGSATYTLNGWMADFRKFDSVLTSTDRANIVAGLEPVTISSLHLKMNEGIGTTLWDYVM